MSSHKICQNYLAGYCGFGDQCKYKHPSSLQAKPLKLEMTASGFINHGLSDGSMGPCIGKLPRFTIGEQQSKSILVKEGGKCTECTIKGYHADCWHCKGTEKETTECNYYNRPGGCKKSDCPFVHVKHMPMA